MTESTDARSGQSKLSSPAGSSIKKMLLSFCLKDFSLYKTYLGYDRNRIPLIRAKMISRDGKVKKTNPNPTNFSWKYERETTELLDGRCLDFPDGSFQFIAVTFRFVIPVLRRTCILKREMVLINRLTVCWHVMESGNWSQTNSFNRPSHKATANKVGSKTTQRRGDVRKRRCQSSWIFHWTNAQRKGLCGSSNQSPFYQDQWGLITHWETSWVSTDQLISFSFLAICTTLHITSSIKSSLSSWLQL